MAKSIMETINLRKPAIFVRPTVFVDVDDTLVICDEKVKGLWLTATDREIPNSLLTKFGVLGISKG